MRTVQGEGPQPARVMLVGDRVGRQEARWGRPFCGDTGAELEVLLRRNGIDRGSCYVTNLVKQYTEADIDAGMVRAWAGRLQEEILRVQPAVVVGFGAAVSHWLLRFTPYADMSMEMMHGMAIQATPVPPHGCVVVPCYNPAAGLRRGDLMVQVHRDLHAVGVTVREVLSGVLEVECAPPLTFAPSRDRYPTPRYQMLLQPAQVEAFFESELEVGTESLGADTEGSAERPFSIQLSGAPGNAVFIPARPELVEVVRRRLPAFHLLLHNSLHDLEVLTALGVEVPKFTDTMVMAFHRGDVSQALKVLAWRLCGMRMREYREVVAPYQHDLCAAWLELVAAHDWPDPAPELVLDKGKWRVRQPQGLNKRIARALRTYQRRQEEVAEDDAEQEEESEPKTLHQWWRKQVSREQKQVVATVCGEMPVAGLEDAPQDEAVQYACADADATLRVYMALESMEESE